jgi:hypothetical protein
MCSKLVPHLSNYSFLTEPIHFYKFMVQLFIAYAHIFETTVLVLGKK